MNLTEPFMINVEDHSSKSLRIDEEHIYCLALSLLIQITNQRYTYVCSCIYLKSFFKSFQLKQLYIWKDLSETILTVTHVPLDTHLHVHL